MSEDIKDKTEQQLKSEIAEISIKIVDQEAQKKQDTALHNETINDLKGERMELIDEVKRRRNEA